MNPLLAPTSLRLARPPKIKVFGGLAACAPAPPSLLAAGRADDTLRPYEIKDYHRLPLKLSVLQTVIILNGQLGQTPRNIEHHYEADLVPLLVLEFDIR